MKFIGYVSVFQNWRWWTFWEGDRWRLHSDREILHSFYETDMWRHWVHSQTEYSTPWHEGTFQNLNIKLKLMV